MSTLKTKELEAIIETIKKEFPEEASGIIRSIVKIELS
jgi:hypothetical protein